MRSKAVIVARVLLGLVFLVFGLNGFLHWFPLPTMRGAAAEFMGGLVASGYFFPLLFGTYTITGAVLLTGRFVPVIVNIVAVHLFLAPSGFPLTTRSCFSTVNQRRRASGATSCLTWKEGAG